MLKEEKKKAKSILLLLLAKLHNLQRGKYLSKKTV